MKGYVINVKDFDVKKRIRVQDAFFKLGLSWIGGSYQYLEQCYTTYGNVDTNGIVADYLMFGKQPISEKEKPYEVTYDQLMEEAFGKTEKDTMQEQTITVETLLPQNVYNLAKEYSLRYWFLGDVDYTFRIIYDDIEYLVDTQEKLDKLRQMIEIDKELRYE